MTSIVLRKEEKMKNFFKTLFASSLIINPYQPDVQPELTAEAVECYREVFADAPWHEWMKCSKCQKYWGTQDRELLLSCDFQHCGEPLVDFWPRDRVAADLYQEAILPLSSCWLARRREPGGLKLVGFCMGYGISVADLETKLGIQFGGAFSLDGSSVVAYQAELGVLGAYRGCGIARELFGWRLSGFRSQHLQVGIVRTRRFPEPSQTFLWYTKKLGYEILATYPGDDGRVILGRPLAGLLEMERSDMRYRI